MAILGTGTTVTFGTSGFSAAVMSVSVDGITRPAIQTSHMGTTGAHTFTPGKLVDSGTITLSIQFDASLTPPVISQTAAETVTIAWAGSNDTWAASCISTDFSATAENEDLITGDLTLKVNGSWVI